MPKVTAVIPTHNGLVLLEKNLPQVLKAMQDNDEVMIVDDASTDTTVQWLKETFQLSDGDRASDENGSYSVYTNCITLGSKMLEITVLKNESNLRFAEAVNRGVKLSKHAYIFLLNNDVAPFPKVLKYLLSYFKSSQVFAVGCLEYQSDAEQSSGRNKLWFERGLFQHARAKRQVSGKTAWVSGGSGLFDREKWLILGGFDKRFYPAYWEDVDLSYRATQKGWKVWFSAEAQVHHNHESTNTTVFGQKQIAQMSWRHQQLFTWLHSSTKRRLLFLLWWPYHFWKMSNSIK
ncbi:MAG: glycosyltransferase family 2 protein [bacterium]|nr:glycosyltransferase family 2 protein [bacterium]